MAHASEIAQHGGAALAVSSAALGWANATMGWINHNSPAILALCGVAGVLISYMGYRAKRRHDEKLFQHELRMKQRRNG